MFILQKSNKKAPIRPIVGLKGVKDGVLMLPHGEFRAVHEVSSVNFELKSEDEQDMLIDTYESFLNSLPCPMQIVVRIRELDVSRYLADLQTDLVSEEEEVYKQQIENYGEFVQDLVADNHILSRHFYIVLPFVSKNADIDAAKEQLTINGDIVSKGLMRLGIRTRQLDSLEVLQLFQSFYNPLSAKQYPIGEHVAQLVNSSYTVGVKE